MADTLSELKLSSDPDAQAAVTDFLDYTEFFPSDLFRSLSLIGKLDETYQNDALKVHELTKTYGLLPKLTAAQRPDPQSLRKELSNTLAHAIRCRESTFAEANRLCNLADGLYNRLVGIKKKLETLPKPPSRDPTPSPQSRSPISSKNRKNENERASRITLHVDDHRHTSRLHVNNRPRHRVRRIIVPGEVLPPYEIESPTGSDSESDSDRTATPTLHHVRVPERSGVEKVLKLSKPTTIRIHRPSAARSRPHGIMGTNVHSQVAGISVSNAMAILQPPPPNPKLGSKHAPWLKLTEWELNKLRKRMKKNADWVPSDTMVRRELAENGRGYENFIKAKAQAQMTGEELVDEEPEAFIRPMSHRSQPSTVTPDNSLEQLENRGMKLNQAKKLKRETLLKEQAALEQAARCPGTHGDILESQPAIYGHGKQVDDREIPGAGSITIKAREGVNVELNTSKPAPEKRSHKKRKREPSPETAHAVIDPALLVPSEHESKSTVKKLKLGVPLVSVKPSSSASNEDITSLALETDKSSVSSDLTSQFTKSAAFEDVSSLESKLDKPSVAASRTSAYSKDRPVLELKPPKAVARPSRGSTKAATTPIPESAPLTEHATARPRSRGTTIISLTFNKKKAASAEPPSRRASGRRTSNASLPSTQASKPSSKGLSSSVGSAGRRGRRPAPGVLASSDIKNEGGVQVILGKRKAAPGQQKGATTGNKYKGPPLNATLMPTSVVGGDQENEGEPIDPNEPTYCICGDVSWGTMVACENEACEKEWFHLGCVHLTEIPGRRTKWYCPECRVKLRVTEFGESVAKVAAGALSGGRK